MNNNIDETKKGQGLAITASFLVAISLVTALIVSFFDISSDLKFIVNIFCITINLIGILLHSIGKLKYPKNIVNNLLTIAVVFEIVIVLLILIIN